VPGGKGIIQDYESCESWIFDESEVAVLGQAILLKIVTNYLIKKSRRDLKVFNFSFFPFTTVYFLKSLN